MASLRHFALGCCILCSMAGMIRIFWPENSFKPVINTVLLLYIVASVLRMAHASDWNGFAAEIHNWSMPVVDTDAYTDYTEALGVEVSAEAIGTLLRQSGIRASVILEDGICHVRLADVGDYQAAHNLLDQYSGALPFVLEKEDGTPCEPNKN